MNLNRTAVPPMIRILGQLQGKETCVIDAHETIVQLPKKRPKLIAF